MTDAAVQFVPDEPDDASGDVYVRAGPPSTATPAYAIDKLRTAMTPQPSPAPEAGTPTTSAEAAMAKIRAALGNDTGTGPASASAPATAADTAISKIQTVLAGNALPSSPPPAPANRKATLTSTVGELGSGLSQGAINAVGLPFDVAAGVENLGIRGVNALTGWNLPFAKGGSQRLSELFGAVDPRMNPQNNSPQNLAESIARGAGAGAGGAAVLPGVAGALNASGLSGLPMQAVNAAAGPLSAGNVAVNAAAGAGGEAAASAVPDRYRPLAQMAGSLAAGGAVTPLTEGPTVARAGVEGAKGFVAPMTEAGRQQLAADTFAKGVHDPVAARAALDAYEGPTVPGSNLTTAQVTGDIGVGAMERAAETTTPVPFNVRRAEQGEARASAIKALQPTGDPAKVAEYVRQQMSALDAAGSASEAKATQAARGVAANIGQASGATPESQGAAMRGALASAKASAKSKERALWDAIDPDNSLVLPAGGIKQTAAAIDKSLPSTAKPIGGEERAILNTIAKMTPTAKFNEFAALRSRVSAAMKEELRDAGETPKYGRLAQLRAGIEDAISSAIEHKSAQEAAAVAAGTMDPKTTMAAKLRDIVDDLHLGREESSGADVGNDNAGGGGGAPSFVRGADRTESATQRGLGTVAGSQGLPSAANFDEAAAERLKAATAATKERANTFGQGAVGDALRTQGQQGNYRILDSAVGAKFFKPGPGGADAVNAFRKAAGGDAEAARALEGYAGLSLRKAALNPDGTLDPGKFAAWQRAHADALRAMPEVASKFSDAAKASEAVADAGAAKAQALDAYQEGAVAKVMGMTDPESVTNVVGRIFQQPDAIGAMRKLAQTVKTNPEARDGLRKAIADFLVSKAISTTGDVKADTFQRFVRDSRPVIGQAFSVDEFKGIEAVAEELSRVNRIVKQASLPARSNTAMDLLSQRPEGGHNLSLFAEMMLGGSAGYEAAGLRGAVAGAGAAVGKQLVLSARAAGMETVKDLVRGMLLHPELARAALARANLAANPPLKDQAVASLRRLQAQFARVATITANRMVSRPQD